MSASGGGEIRYDLEQPDRSLGQLVGDLVGEFSTLVRDHIDLAKVEIKQDIKHASKPAGMFGVAGVAALVAIIMLSMAAAWGLAEAMDPGWAFLVVGAAWAIAAAVLAMTGKKRIEQIDPAPRQTMEEIQEDKRWIATQKR